jgi:Ca2+-transporting ATPase
MLLLLVATALVYLALGDLTEAIAVIVAVGVVVGLTLYQERKTEHTLAALKNLSSPRALVVRDGITQRIPGREVVVGDELVLNEGDRVPADALLTTSSHLSLDESLLTGESMPVLKSVLAGERTSVYSGTLIVAGHGTAIVDATGVRSKLGQIGSTLSTLDIERTAIQTEVSRVVRLLAASGALACLVVAIVYGSTQGRWLDGALAGLTMAIAMVPEEFPVILTVFFALGAWRISQSRVLTRRIPAVETLGAATVLCTDKTGTLTMNRMAVAAIVPYGATEKSVIDHAALASKVDPIDPMERALFDAATRDGSSVARARDDLVREYPLTDSLPAVGYAWREREDGVRVAVKGAPEAVLSLCRVDDEVRRRIEADVDTNAAAGLRVIGVATSDPINDPPASLRDLRCTFLGLVGFADPLRPGVPEAVEECRNASVRVVMITGDYPTTASQIAKQAGIDGYERCLTGADLAALDETAFAREIQQVNVFARMVPHQKLRLVQALKASGEVVAMTGDGVNDAPALKAAHIGIAMGARGSDVAREAAGLVLLDDDFTSIVRAIRLGRRIYDNIKKAMAYAFAIHVPIGGMSLVPVLSGGPLILLPLHLIFMELIVDPACSVAFEMEPEEPDVMRRPPRPRAQRMFDRHLVVRSTLQGVGVLAIAMIVYGSAVRLGLAAIDVRTLAFVTLITGNLALIFTNRSREPLFSPRPPNPGLRWVAASALGALALVLYVPPLRNVFLLGVPHPLDLVAVGAAAIGMVIWVEAIKAIDRRV